MIDAEQLPTLAKAAKKQLAIVLSSTLAFALVAFNLFYGFSKYENLYLRIKDSKSAIDSISAEINETRKLAAEAEVAIAVVESEIDEVKSDLYVVVDDLKKRIRELRSVADDYQLSEVLVIDDFLDKTLSDEKRVKAYIDFLNDEAGQYRHLLRLDADRRMRVSDEAQLAGRYAAHFEYLNLKRSFLRVSVSGNGGFNLTNIEYALRHHQILFDRINDLGARIRNEEESIATSISGNSSLVELSAKRQSHYDSLGELETALSRLFERQVEAEEAYARLEGAKNQAEGELSQSYKVSGIPISSAILLPVTHVALVFLFGWFTLNLHKTANLAGEATKGKQALAGIEADWFFLHRDRATSVISMVLMFVPLKYSLLLALVSLAYLRPMIQVLDLDFDFFLVGTGHCIIAIVSGILLLGGGVIGTMLKIRLRRLLLEGNRTDA